MKHLRDNISKGWNQIDESWRVAITAFVIARIFYFVWAWVIFTIQPVVIQNLELSDQPILSIFKLENSEAHVYLREVNGEVLTFQTVDTQHLIDQQTGSIWELSTGTAIQGQYEGTTLETAKTTPSDIFPYHDAKPYPGVWLSMWQRFDANWYVSLAENGYGKIPGDDHFPPLFPLLIRLFQQIFGNAFLAGLFVAHIATLLMLKLLYDVFTQWGETDRGTRAVLFFVIYPTFFFFFSAYSEPVFLVLALLALRAMHKQHWAWAGFWTFCAILTRLQGAALLFPMLYLIWKDQPPLRKFSHWFGLAVAGLGGLVYLYQRSTQVTGNALPLTEAEWHARIVPPWETYWYAVQTIFQGHATFIDILNWSIMTLFIILLIWGWKKIPLEYNLYTAISIFIILIRIVETQPLISMSRYSVTLFPVFYAFSLGGENPWLRRVITYGFILLHLYLSGQFLIWGWVA